MKSRIFSSLLALLCAFTGIAKLYFAYEVGAQHELGHIFAIFMLPVSACWLGVAGALALRRSLSFKAVLLLLAGQFLLNPLLKIAQIAVIKAPFEEIQYFDAILQPFKSTSLFDLGFYLLLVIHTLQFYKSGESTEGGRDAA